MQLKCGVSERYILGLFILRLFGWLSGVSEILLKELAGSSQWHKRHYIVATLKSDTVYGNHAAKIRWSKHRYHNWQQGMSETNWRLISVEYVDTNFNWNNYASYTDGKMLVEPGIWYIFYTIGILSRQRNNQRYCRVWTASQICTYACVYYEKGSYCTKHRWMSSRGPFTNMDYL